MKSFYELRFFLILWLTQAFSSLGSAMTNFALVLWLYQDSGSALKSCSDGGRNAGSCKTVCWRNQGPLEQESRHAGLR